MTILIFNSHGRTMVFDGWAASANQDGSGGKFWFGDIDLTDDLEQLKLAAKERGEDVYVLREMDARFRNESAPLFENAVARIEPTGAVHMLEKQHAR